MLLTAETELKNLKKMQYNPSNKQAESQRPTTHSVFPVAPTCGGRSSTGVTLMSTLITGETFGSGRLLSISRNSK